MSLTSITSINDLFIVTPSLHSLFSFGVSTGIGANWRFSLLLMANVLILLDVQLQLFVRYGGYSLILF